MAVELGEDGVGDRPDADLERRPVGDALGDARRDAPVDVERRARRKLDHRRVGLAPADELAHVELVLAERTRHARVHLDEEGQLADERRRVLGVTPQREVAMPIGW